MKPTPYSRLSAYSSPDSIGEIPRHYRFAACATNLLALNAALKAGVRVSPCARFWLVVADEVRTLAAAASKATGEIRFCSSVAMLRLY